MIDASVTNVIKENINNGFNIVKFIISNLMGLLALGWTTYQEIRRWLENKKIP